MTVRGSNITRKGEDDRPTKGKIEIFPVDNAVGPGDGKIRSGNLSSRVSDFLVARWGEVKIRGARHTDFG
jgi:hypothetical protein